MEGKERNHRTSKRNGYIKMISDKKQYDRIQIKWKKVLKMRGNGEQTNMTKHKNKMQVHEWKSARQEIGKCWIKIDD